jgi:hypothetical protein
MPDNRRTRPFIENLHCREFRCVDCRSCCVGTAIVKLRYERGDRTSGRRVGYKGNVSLEYPYPQPLHYTHYSLTVFIDLVVVQIIEIALMTLESNGIPPRYAT